MLPLALRLHGGSALHGGSGTLQGLWDSGDRSPAIAIPAGSEFRHSLFLGLIAVVFGMQIATSLL